MAKYLTILAVALTVGAAAQTKKPVAHVQPGPTVIIYKPAVPKVVRCQYFAFGYNVQPYVLQCAKDGYIIKTITSSGNSSWIVLAEKY